MLIIFEVLQEEISKRKSLEFVKKIVHLQWIFVTIYLHHQVDIDFVRSSDVCPIIDYVSECTFADKQLCNTNTTGFGQHSISSSCKKHNNKFNQ